MSNPKITHEVLFDGEHFMYAQSITAARDYARGARKPLRARGDRYVGRFTIRLVERPQSNRLDSVIDSTKFLMVGSEKQGGAVLRVTYKPQSVLPDVDFRGSTTEGPTKQD